MCGISGIINYDISNTVSIEDLKPITDVIAHRGPDGFGYWQHNNIGFGHRRLSIIDLEGSKQPMKIDDDKFVITYNGEIYNYLELKKELQKLGFTFKTTGDTEVILKSYQYWGEKCVEKFRGMFSFAIANISKSEIFLARDHFGIKPLVYYQGENFFMFGSEIQQFSKHKDFIKSINVTALSEYMKFGYIPAPLTIYNNLFKLEPGNYIKLNFEGEIIEHKEYYDIQFKPDYKVSYHDWVERVEEAVDISVKYHKIADVPYGTFLSGGIDSSIIASSLAKEGKNVDAFTMGFENEAFNEVPYAKQVAEKYNLNHHIEYIDMQDMQDVFPKLIKHYGEPFADSSSIPTYYITKKISEHLPVVLSGDGGDEAFGGYYSYQNFLKILKPSAPKHAYKDVLKKALKYIGKTYPNTPRQPSLNDWINLISFFNINETNKIFRKDVIKDFDIEYSSFNKWYKKAKSQRLDTYSTGSYLDYKTYLYGDILTKVDIASMMNSLEVRTPLIDVDIVNLMAKIPSKHKISRNYNGSWQKKKILNSIAEKRFDKEFVSRKKQGFSIPLKDWFQPDNDFGNEFFKIIKNKNSSIFEYFNENEIKSNFLNKENINYSKMFQIFTLENWLNN
ncbi:asparagine synthase (glutamine-hydrolyzing) [Polaribacter sp. Hel1_85]|uniref:asparagine synthase (glutamine-hydrolyzing) n=1 Tax=Polaribacter sp. Hel1_85 TaxID=1250005 RepID=UPI00052DFA69|nr:asparagine synthase (glutamine-hydrolyzing) [Polaribacter sp. Hel1_85]KGL63232.1 asparagine synthetase (glutamine-hydrolyzing) [Polaribacter sp. Hel1_85]